MEDPLEHEILYIPLSEDVEKFLLFSVHEHDVCIEGQGFSAKIMWDDLVDWLYNNEP